MPLLTAHRYQIERVGRYLNTNSRMLGAFFLVPRHHEISTIDPRKKKKEQHYYLRDLVHVVCEQQGGGRGGIYGPHAQLCAWYMRYNEGRKAIWGEK